MKLDRASILKTTLILAVVASVAIAMMAGLAALAGERVETETGLVYIDDKVGTGATPSAGQVVDVHYTGWLYRGGEKGSKFDSSLDRGKPLSFPLGQGRVIRGWDEGVSTMKVGGKRTLIIPPNLAYGARGAGGVIPPHAVLLFEVELVGIQE